MAEGGGALKLGAVIIGLVLIALGVAANFGLPQMKISCGTGCTVQGNLVGYVTDKNTGLGIVGALVKLATAQPAYQTTTGAGGYFQFQQITTANYQITISSVAYTTLTASVGVPAYGTGYFNAQLSLASTGTTSTGQGCPISGSTQQCNTSPPAPPPGVAPPSNNFPATNTTTAPIGNVTAPPPFNAYKAVGGTLVGFLLILAGSVLAAVGLAVGSGRGKR